MRPSLAREARLLVTAVAFLTRLAVPAVPHQANWLARSAKFFPLVGLGVGGAAAAVLIGAAQLWTGAVPALLAVAFALAVTGALHEDGLADTADGIGGLTVQARLAIMKDSRLGTYGALALGIGLSVRVAALASLAPAVAAGGLAAAGAGARLAAVLLMSRVPYAGDPGAAKVRQGLSMMPGEIALACAFGVLPLLLLPPGRAVAGLALGGAAAALVAWRACRALGGQTGDVLGAVASVYETGFLLGTAAWREGA